MIPDTYVIEQFLNKGSQERDWMGRETMRSFGKIVLCAYGVTKYRVVVGYKFISQQENIEF